MEKSVNLPAALARALLQYLDERPHREVRALIDGVVAAVQAAEARPWPPVHKAEVTAPADSPR